MKNLQCPALVRMEGTQIGHIARALRETSCPSQHEGINHHELKSSQTFCSALASPWILLSSYRTSPTLFIFQNLTLSKPKAVGLQWILGNLFQQILSQKLTTSWAGQSIAWLTDVVPECWLRFWYSHV